MERLKPVEEVTSYWAMPQLNVHHRWPSPATHDLHHLVAPSTAQASPRLSLNPPRPPLTTATTHQ